MVNTKNHAKHPGIASFLMVLFAILVPILLLNMLIAMMAKTYSEIMARALMEWKRQVSSLYSEHDSKESRQIN